MSKFHQIPEPKPEVSGVNNRAYNSGLRTIIAKWRPKGARETGIATLSRFAHRLIGANGEAYTAEDLAAKAAEEITPESIGAASADQGALADTASQPGHTHPITDLNITGATDIGAGLADADEINVYDASAGANRKAAASRVWTYLQSKLAALSSITVGGAWSFGSTTRPTSSGSGTPASNSLITLSDADVRYPRAFYVSGSATNSTVTPVTAASISAIPAGTYLLDCFLRIETPNVETMDVRVDVNPAPAAFTRRLAEYGPQGTTTWYRMISTSGSTAGVTVSVPAGGQTGGRGGARFYGELVFTAAGSIAVTYNNVLAEKGSTSAWCYISLTKQP